VTFDTLKEEIRNCGIFSDPRNSVLNTYILDNIRGPEKHLVQGNFQAELATVAPFHVHVGLPYNPNFPISERRCLKDKEE
jgi:hypothetical protein